MTIKIILKIPRPNLGNARLLVLSLCSTESTSWLHSFLLPCPFKFVTGIDCPGCGFQRSLIALLQGNWLLSYQLYPPTIPLLFVLLYALVKKKLGFDKQDIFMKIIAVACGWFILWIYGVKLWSGNQY